MSSCGIWESDEGRVSWTSFYATRLLAPRCLSANVISTANITRVVGSQGIFGVPLHQSIRYANVAISLFNDEGQSYIYGYVPIVVAKCGVFLKEKGTWYAALLQIIG